MQAALPQETRAAAPAPETPAPAGPAVRVEAVEIDGRKIFVAGSAEPGRTVRGYANEILLGDAKVSPDGSYLIEAERDLPVGDYIIRVDALEPDGVKVAARAAVPFEREPGETIAAVAPQAPRRLHQPRRRKLRRHQQPALPRRPPQKLQLRHRRLRKRRPQPRKRLPNSRPLPRSACRRSHHHAAGAGHRSRDAAGKRRDGSAGCG